ncbi:DNA mimic protein [Psychrobacter sp. FME5]|nr:DNA mimic protein [Psychrobacter sp. FME6]MBE0444594.1 DNA mimic protein [Psychrobacter sp. FME5]
MDNEFRYRFFCLPNDINIDDYVETIDWGNNNLQANTVLPLTVKNVEYYQEINL